MKTILFILEKEFRQILRDPSVLRIMLIMPVIQLIVLPMAADYEIKNIRLVVLDRDKSTYARQLIHKVSSSGYFLLDEYVENIPDAMKEIEQDRADIIMEIPAQFERLFQDDRFNGWYNVTAVKLEDGLVVSMSNITIQKKQRLILEERGLLLKEAEGYNNLSQNHIKEIKNEQITSSAKR